MMVPPGHVAEGISGGEENPRDFLRKSSHLRSDGPCQRSRQARMAAWLRNGAPCAATAAAQTEGETLESRDPVSPVNPINPRNPINPYKPYKPYINPVNPTNPKSRGTKAANKAGAPTPNQPDPQSAKGGREQAQSQK